MSSRGNEHVSRNEKTVSTRRGVLRFAGGAAAIAALAAMGEITVDAKRRGKGKGKGKKKQQVVCQPGQSIGSVSVPATGTMVSTPILIAGQRYRLRASGFWSSNATHGQDAFADFAFATPATPVTTFQGVRLGLEVDGGSPDFWGSYSTGHVYEREIVGQGRAVTLRCSDVVFTDNSGTVLVDVFCA